MHSSTEETSRAIQSSHRQFTHSLWVDWNNDGKFDHPLSDMSPYVGRTKRDQAISSTAPEELMLIEGYAAGAMDIEATGTFRGSQLATHFAPYSGRSIFYTEGLQLGVSMRYDIGVWTDEGWEWFRQFTGVVRDVNADRETGGVTLDCLDNVERLRTSVGIPPFALWQDYLQDGYKRGGLIDSSSIIDLAARSGNFSMGPTTPWTTFRGMLRGKSDPGSQPYGPILSVPFHGSVLPEFGMCDGDMSFHLTESWENNQFKYRSEAYVPGPHGYLALNGVPPDRADGWGYKKYWIDEWDGQAGNSRGSWVLGTWIYWTGDGVDGESTIIDLQIRKNKLQLHVTADGQVQARFRETATGFHPWTNSGLRMVNPGWYYIEGFFNIATFETYTLQVRLNDQRSTASTWTGRANKDENDPISGLVTVRNKYALSDLFVSKVFLTTTYDQYDYDRTPADTARVSWGRNRVTYTLREMGREAWDLAKEVSSAEYGTTFFDEFGRFVFWNYRDMVERQSSPVRTFTVDDLESLSLRNTFDSVRNVWNVTTKTAQSRDGIAYDLANDGVPFRRDANGQLYPVNFVLPPGTRTIVFTQPSEYVISVNPWPIPYLAEFAPWEEHIPIRGIKSYSGDTYRAQGPPSEQKLVQRDLARLSLWNGYGEHVGFMITSTGQLRFRFSGRLVIEDRESSWSIRDDASVAEYGERVIDLKDNFWLQDRWQTEGMLRDIVSRMGRPIPVSDKVTVPGDPRIQIGDLVQIQDSDGFGEMTWLQVYGIERELDAENGLTDTYTVEAVKSSGEGIWDSESYAIWDQSLIWS